MPVISRFASDEKGAVTVEFTVLVPFFIFLLVLFSDAAVIYLTHSEMYNLTRDAARRMATRELKDEGDVKAYAESHLFLSERTYTIQTEFESEIRVIIAVPVGEAAIFGAFFRPILGKSLIASATAQLEPRVLPTS